MNLFPRFIYKIFGGHYCEFKQYKSCDDFYEIYESDYFITKYDGIFKKKKKPVVSEQKPITSYEEISTGDGIVMFSFEHGLFEYSESKKEN